MTRRISTWRFLSSFHRILALRFPIILAAVLLTLGSCYNEPEFIGGNLIPNSDITSVKIDTSFDVAAFTIKTDTITTNIYSYGTLGCYNSDFFGKVKSDFVTRLIVKKLSDDLMNTKPRPTADSLILKLVLKKSWGTEKKPINVTVYELSDSMISKKYYNGLAPIDSIYYPTPISLPKTYSGEDTLKIKLTPEFANKLINAPDSAFINDYKFLKYFYGLYITSDDYNGTDGVLYYFYYNASMTLHYKKLNKKDELIDTVYNYFTSLYTPRFNHYIHDYTKVRPDLQFSIKEINSINETTVQDSVFCLDGLGGVRGLIKLNLAKEWISRMKIAPIAINKAELRFAYQDHPEFPADSSINNRMYYYMSRTFDKITLTPYDLLTYDTRVFETNTSTYFKAKNYYSIDVTLQFQNILNGNIKNDYILIEPVDFKFTYLQGLYRTGANSNPVKLIITYSELHK